MAANVESVKGGYMRDDTSIINGRERSGISWLPDNISQYFNEHYATIDISICHTDVENGYGVRISKCFRILLPFCRCTNCGYHSLWNPDDTNSKCLRHTYTKGWDTVFSYTLDNAVPKISLKDAFDKFLSAQSSSSFMPIKKMSF